MGSKIPYFAVNNEYKQDFGSFLPSFWTNGFWAGICWQMYQATGNEKYKDTARITSDILNKLLLKADELYHDVGFMWLNTSVADYRITKDEDARKFGLHAANILAGRFNPAGGFIRAWNDDGREGFAIIDCMMNINLLYWAYEVTGDPRYKHIAIRHADTTLENHIREDGSVYHIVSIDPENGAVAGFPENQGYSSTSSWSRGQAWALYGFALSYRHTKDIRYLNAAKQVAHYFIANVSLADWIPLVDFRAPKEPVYIDTTAGAIAASGLLEIEEYVPEFEKAFYSEAALCILKSTEEKYADWDESHDGIISGGTGSYHGHNGNRFDADVPIIYGDYYFLEAVLRLLGKGVRLW
ncbi:MAG TPA: glycosyl hydrolase family 88 [Clostridiales bacterium]|nr:glycosyl hydrolase family 88 [Clostridiales bacterium]